MSSEYTSRSGNPAWTSSGATRVPDDATEGLRTKATEGVSKIAEAVQRAGSEAREAASSLTSEVNQKAKGILDQKVTLGADLAGHVADSVKSAADNLDRNAPRLAEMVRGAADKVDEFSHNLREQSIDDLLRTTSDFTRRQPAVVFGLAALAGFFLFRVLKSNPSSAAEGGSYRGAPRSPQRSSQFHGA